VPVSDARQELAELIAWSVSTSQPAIITNHGKPQAALIGIRAYRRALRILAAEALRLRRSRLSNSTLTDEAIEAAGTDAVERTRRSHSDQ
jgi:prevent-host-death family protein